MADAEKINDLRGELVKAQHGLTETSSLNRRTLTQIRREDTGPERSPVATR